MDNVECKWSYAGDNKHREHVIPGPFKKEGVSGKKVCADCCRFLGWVWEDGKQPEPKELREATRTELDIVYMLNHKLSEMNEWEQSFIKDLSKRYKWSEKQTATYERIKSKFFTSNDQKEENHEPVKPAEQQSVTSVDELPQLDDFDVPF